MLTFLLALVLAVAPLPSLAPFGVQCRWDPWRLEEVCIVTADPPPPSVGDGTGGTTGAAGSGGCSYQGAVIPCTSAESGGWWSAQYGCYVRPSEPAPPFTDPIWQGHTDGGLYLCVAGPAGQPWPGAVFWLPQQPGGPGAPPDPVVVARAAVERMGLRRIAIGMVPESGLDRVGVVGMPAWMWVSDKSDQTYGPITRTATSGSVSVTATAEVARIVWDMGDGTRVTCRTPGTPFRDGDGGKASPDCGHVYQRQGTYTVTATTFWEVRWSGGGQSGTIPVQMSSSTTVVIGELQTVVR